jgi:triosephosphate isomerase
MRNLLVAGNWKMNGSEESIRTLLGGLLEGLETGVEAEVAVFPPFPYLALVQSLLDGSRVSWGGQTLNPQGKGAFTGEVAASMLVDFGCQYVLVGHSERRALYGESDADVAERFAAAQEAGLEPVLCVGETMEERQSGATETVIDRQLQAVLDQVDVAAFERSLIAYEPVWAIGTGLTATPLQAQQVHGFIRDKLRALDGTIGGQIRILYGGSVNASNAADLFSQEDIDGALVGGASLTAEAFLGICHQSASV